MKNINLNNKKELKYNLEKYYRKVSSSEKSFGYKMQSIHLLDIIDKLNPEKNFKDKLDKYFYPLQMMIDENMLSKRNIFKDIDDNIEKIKPELEKMNISDNTLKEVRDEYIACAMMNLKEIIN